MVTSVKSLYNSQAQDIPIGSNKKLTIASSVMANGIKGVIYKGMTFADRSVVNIVPGDEYPEFYNGSYTYYPNTFWASNGNVAAGKTISSESYGTTLIYTVELTGGGSFIIGRSTNNGTTSTTITHPLATSSPLQVLFKNTTTNTWVILISSTSAVMSTDDGVNFTGHGNLTGLTSFPAYTFAAARLIRTANIGGKVIMTDGTRTWTTINNIAWTDITTTVPGGKLTTGNGYVVIISSSGDVKYTSDGTTWASGGNWSPSIWSWNYGLLWDGTRWYWSCQHQTYLSGTENGINGTGVPTTEPAPNYLTPASYSVTTLQRSAGGTPVIAEGNTYTWSSGGGFNTNSGYWYFYSGSPFGSSLNMGPRTSTGYFLYSINQYSGEHWPTVNGSKLAYLFANTTAPSNLTSTSHVEMHMASGYSSGGVMSNGQWWSSKFGSADITQFHYTKAGGTPNLSLAILADTYVYPLADGNLFTRIK